MPDAAVLLRTTSGCVMVGALCAAACGRAPGGDIRPVYDRSTGRLSELVYDSNRDGRPDTWSYMDGPRVVRVEVDATGDGAVDRWEYYDVRGRLERIGISRAGGRTVDTWMYPDADGSIARVEHAARGGDRVTRREYYIAGQLDRAEEDVNGDGRPDKWERYRGAALSTVAFDTSGQGRPDRTFVYNADGTLHHIEDAAGESTAASDASRNAARK